MAHETHPLTSVADQASYWWVVFRDGSATPEERREFGEWIARSPERVEAYLRVARVQRALNDPELTWPKVSAETLIREAKAAREDVVTFTPPRPMSHEERRADAGVGANWGWALAASVLLVAFACVGWYALMRPPAFETAFAEQRSVPLKDGSHVTLNTASKIEVNFESTHRTVRLLQGEALFEVAHDAARPFDVVTNHAVVRAVGTQFDVYQQAERTIITVVEGHVAIFDAANAGVVNAAPRSTLGPGDRLSIARDGTVSLQQGVNVSAATGWTRRQLIFEHRPLGVIADELNRYNRDRIEILSSELRDREITGTFRSNDARSFVSYLAGIPGVSIETNAAGDHIVTFAATEGSRK